MIGRLLEWDEKYCGSYCGHLDIGAQNTVRTRTLFLLWAFQREKFWNNIYKTKQGFANETNLSVLITIIRLVLLWLGEPNHDEAQSFQVRKGQLRFLFECAIISAFEALRFVCMTEEQPYHQLHDICEKVLFKFNYIRIWIGYNSKMISFIKIFMY